VLDGDWLFTAAIPVAMGIVLLRLGTLRTAAALVGLFHLTLVASQALFPIPIEPAMLARAREAADAGVSGTAINLVPFDTIAQALVEGGSRYDRRLLVLNTLVLAPAGVWLPLLAPRLHRFTWFLPVGLAVGASIELAQAVASAVIGVRYRSLDVDDVLLNTAGVFAAWLLVELARGGWRVVRARVSADPITS
jgi:glycopeptide antibiotics resistance protein